MSVEISVIIPAYNSEKYIKATIDSILVQRPKDIEIIIVDDGSTDNTPRIIDGYAEKYCFLQAYHIPNHGVSYARNYGLKRATGKWICFIDSDDCISDNLFSICRNYSDFDLIVYGANFYYPNHTVCVNLHEQSLRNCEDIRSYLNGITIEDKPAFLNYLWNRLFKREIISINNMVFDETISLGEDFVFITEYLQYCKNAMILEKAYYNYYIRGNNSLTGRFDECEGTRRKMMRNSYIRLLSSYNLIPMDNKTFVNNEGLNCIISLKKLNNEKCYLTSRKKRCNYIRSLLDRESKWYMKQYIKTNPSMFNIILYVLLLLNSPILIEVFLNVCKRITRK